MPTRAEWQQLAEDRILDAHTLLNASAPRWSAAYYLVGYAVECGLKSCVLVYLTAHPEVVFRDRKLSDDCWNHEIERLVKTADLHATREADSLANPALGVHWQIVIKWKESSRYEQKTRADAERLYEAVTDPTNGVMQWIRARW